MEDAPNKAPSTRVSLLNFVQALFEHLSTPNDLDHGDCDDGSDYDIHLAAKHSKIGNWPM